MLRTSFIEEFCVKLVKKRGSMESDGGSVFTNSEIKKLSDFDVFLWANEIDEVKNNISCELYLFNKNYTPFKIRYSEKLTNSVK